MLQLLGAAIFTLLVATTASAANTAVSFNGSAVSGCTLAGTTYSCPPFSPTQDVTIASGYKVILSGAMDFDFNQKLTMSGTAQLQTTGTLDIGDISPSNLSITGGTLTASGGTFKIGAQAQTITANIVAAGMTIGTGSTTKITGNLTSTGKVDIASHVTIIGNISGTVIDTNSPVTLTGNVTGSTSFSLASGSTLTGNLVAPVVELKPSPSLVTGNVTASTSLKIGSSSGIKGNVDAGEVELYSSEAYIDGNAAVNTLKLNWHGRVTKVITCKTATANAANCSCVDDGSGYASTPNAPVCAAASSGVHHYEIANSGTALTCEAKNVTIKACSDAACTGTYSGSATVTLAGTGAAAGSSVTFTGSGTATIRDATAETVTLSLSSTTPTPSNNTVCTSSNGGSSCAMVFSKAGLSVSVPNHIAGNAPMVTVSALQASPANPNVCVPLFADSTKFIAFSCSYNNPASGTATPTMTDTTGVSRTLQCNGGATTGVPMSFDANGSGSVPMIYNDVGQVGLTAAYTSTNPPASLAGSTTFITTPYKFVFDNIFAGSAASPGTANPGATGPTGATGLAFMKAGQPFTARVTAYSAKGAVTKNFGRENPAATLSISHIRVAPTTGVDGILTPGTMSSFNNGAATIDGLSWTEVGILKLKATMNTAGGLYAGLTVPTDADLTTSGTIGRFVPDHFDTEVVPGDSAHMTCPTGTNAFAVTCINGKFTYANKPFMLTVKAYNGHTPPALINNYTGEYAHALAITAWNAAGASGAANQNPEYTPLNNAASNTGVMGASPTFTFAKGEASSAISYAFSKNFSTGSTSQISRPVNVYFRATDVDGTVTVSSLRSPAASSVEGGATIASGRLYVTNGYGSNRLAMMINLYAQIWNGRQFFSHAYDNANPLASVPVAGTGTATALFSSGGGVTFVNCNGTLLSGGNCIAALSVASSPDRVSFDKGKASIRLTAPGSSFSGTFDLTVNTVPWLPSTTSRSVFGTFNGGPVVYMREIY
ncbi:MAG: polymer-forming cytoskeletal protein [Burkholderiaceae bacterium]|nr:polymer-forming cytoskeletal protein [Burkholderiaceae bacterium]